ncbi:MAG: hypothetical protein NTZ05_21490, partial [Chloroflexi bacterium]|nr:hypothetical protein [Chloroflexota bacterium]
MAWDLLDKTAIVGIGETEYKRWGQQSRPEFALACEAILKAADDAGIDVKEIDGWSSYANDRNDAIRLAAALGVPTVRFSNMMWGGGGGGSAGVVGNAMMAVASGMANYVVCWRALCQGQFGRFGSSSGGGPQRVSGAAAFGSVHGMFGAPSSIGALAPRRYMHMYGITSRQFGNLAVAAYKHAQRNPRAVMYGRPITIEDHQNSRMIVDPLHLYDCCLENDGAAAVLVTSAERAKKLKQRPVYIMAGAQGSGFGRGRTGHNQEYIGSNHEHVAPDLWARSGVGPRDVDVAQIYVNFTPLAMMAIEDMGFCARGEGGAFCEDGRIEWPNGELPLNTSGGNLAEAYIHG